MYTTQPAEVLTANAPAPGTEWSTGQKRIRKPATSVSSPQVSRGVQQRPLEASQRSQKAPIPKLTPL